MMAAMRSRPAALVLLALTATASPQDAVETAPAAPPLPELSAAFAAARDHVLPEPDELAWRSIGWRPRFGAAMLEADAAGRPVLLWAMNGHPLGCT